MDKNNATSDRNARLLYFIGLCVSCIAINYIGSHIAKKADLPLYLDIIGNILAAIMGGYVPAMVTGFFTNIVNGINDTNIYFCFISLIIAMAAAFFADKKYFNRLSTLPAVIITLAVIGGTLGSSLAWILGGYWFADTTAGEMAKHLHTAYHIPAYLSELAVNLTTDLLDKAIEVAVAVIIMQFVPDFLKRRYLYLRHRRRNADSFWARLRSGRFSLGDKLVVFVIAACSVIAVLVTGISFRTYRNSSKEQQLPLANGVLKIAKRYIDADMIDTYIKEGEKAEGYTETRDNLAHLMNSTKNIEYVYVYKILPYGCQVVFDPDTPDTPGEKPGTGIF